MMPTRSSSVKQERRMAERALSDGNPMYCLMSALSTKAMSIAPTAMHRNLASMVTDQHHQPPTRTSYVGRGQYKHVGKSGQLVNLCQKSIDDANCVRWLGAAHRGLSGGRQALDLHNGAQVRLLDATCTSATDTYLVNHHTNKRVWVFHELLNLLK